MQAEDRLQFDPLLLVGLRPRTVQAYQREVRALLLFARARSLPLESFADLERALVALSGEGRASRAQFEKLLAALECAVPACKGRLPWARARLRAWQRISPPKHTVPMPWRVALAVAYAMAAMGHSRVGALVLLQWACGLRPGEVLGLTRGDLLPPALNHSAPGEGLIVLGARHGTKARRAQSARLLPSESEGSVGLCILRAFVATTPKATQALSAVYSVSVYNRLLRKACQRAGVAEHGFTPHSMRAGWASELRMRGVPFTELKERGRWISDSSLRTYLDAVTTARINLLVPQADAVATYLSMDFAKLYPWWQV